MPRCPICGQPTVYAPRRGRWISPACLLAAERRRIATGVAHAINPARLARRHAAWQRRQSQAVTDAGNEPDPDT
jgi:hypothetical protein